MKKYILIFAILMFNFKEVLNPSTYRQLNQIHKDDKDYIQKITNFQQNYTTVELLMILNLQSLFQILFLYQDELSKTLVHLMAKFEAPHVHEFQKYNHNFASLFGGAIILEKSSGLTQVQNILQESSDNYMIAECSNVNQYFVISLKEEIQLEAVQFINRELYSSNIRNFQLFGGIVFPNNEWELLGQFVGNESEHWQVFQIKPTLIRYLKVVIMDFYQNESLCVVTQIKVFGQTVIGDFMQSYKLKTESQPNNNRQSKKILNYLYDIQGECHAIEHFYLPNEQSRDYLNLIPYESNQSAFKVIAQNIMIVSHNLEMLKSTLNNNLKQLIKDELTEHLTHYKNVNDKLEDQVQKYQITMFIVIPLLILMNILTLLCVFCNKVERKKLRVKSALHVRADDWSDSDAIDLTQNKKIQKRR